MQTKSEIKNIALIPHVGKIASKSLTQNIAKWCEDRSIKVWVSDETAKWTGIKGQICPKEHLSEASDIIIALGGDGTLLNAVRNSRPHGTPVLGINLGHLGFLTEVEPSEIMDALPELVKGNFKLEKRMMLQSLIKRDGQVIKELVGLNDVVISKGALARIIDLETYVGNEYVTTYPSDGLIISSPTGSTAYSLSAGGPIVDPRVDILLITPICPHTFYSRPLVIPDNQMVKVIIRSRHDQVMATVDGQVGTSLQPGDEVYVKKADEVVKLVRLMDRSFYQVLHKRLNEGRI